MSNFESTGGPTGFLPQEENVTRRFSLLLQKTSLRNKIVLDVGCGSGAYCEFAAIKGAKQVVGIDLNKTHLQSSKNVSVMQADALKLPFRNGVFDVVVSFEVFEHLPSEEVALKEIARVTSVGVFFSIAVPNKFFPIETHGLCVGGTRVGIEQIGFPFFSWAPQFIRRHMERARIYTEKGLYQILRKAGFEPIRFHYMMPPLERVGNVHYSRFRGPLRRLLDEFEVLPFFRYFGVSIICICRKKTAFAFAKKNIWQHPAIRMVPSEPDGLS